MFGERLKELRESQGMTQSNLAILLNVSRQSVGGYENDGVEPGIDIIVKIADIFNVSTDFLLCRTEEKYNLNLLDATNKDLLLKLYEAVNLYKIQKK